MVDLDALFEELAMNIKLSQNMSLFKEQPFVKESPEDYTNVVEHIMLNRQKVLLKVLHALKLDAVVGMCAAEGEPILFSDELEGSIEGLESKLPAMTEVVLMIDSYKY